MVVIQVWSLYQGVRQIELLYEWIYFVLKLDLTIKQSAACILFTVFKSGLKSTSVNAHQTEFKLDKLDSYVQLEKYY